MTRARGAADLTQVAAQRFTQHHLAGSACRTPHQVVSWFGAVQAQDFAAMKWAIGVRMRAATDAAVEAAIAQRSIVRTWPLRGTLHVVAAEDVHWLLSLTGPRMLARAAPRYRQLELDEKTLLRTEQVIGRALAGGAQLTRAEIAAALKKSRIDTSGQRLIHVIGHAATRKLICHAPRRGKQFTFTLLDEWVEPTEEWPRDRALAELARRYFMSHGPAQLRDYVWWSGLTAADARAGLKQVQGELESREIDGATYWSAPDTNMRPDVKDSCVLLPYYDEYTVAYADRSAISTRLGAARFPSRGGILDPVVVCGAQVVATWKRALQRGRTVITISPLARMTRTELRRVHHAAQRYGSFLEVPVEMIDGGL